MPQVPSKSENMPGTGISPVSQRTLGSEEQDLPRGTPKLVTEPESYSRFPTCLLPSVHSRKLPAFRLRYLPCLCRRKLLGLPSPGATHPTRWPKLLPMVGMDLLSGGTQGGCPGHNFKRAMR